ncbi:MAG: response regulator transcription factor [Candidatus Latescibacteria bacterium]|nr:response regulator transcription factor [Candidatus Latescibacterota bacterium]
MEHVKIWIQIVTLIVGMGILFDTYQFYKLYRYIFLKHLLWFFLFLNLCFLNGTLSEYLLVNFFDNLILFKSSHYMKMINPLFGVFYIGLFYYLIALSRSFQDKNYPKNLYKLFIGIICFILFRSFLPIVSGIPVEFFEIADWINRGLYFFTFLFSYAILGYFIVKSWSLDDRTKSKTWILFSLFYLGGYSLLTISAMFAGKNHRLFASVIYLSFNLFPFFWYRRFLFRNYNALPYAIAGSDLKSICEKYGVSSRQSEIITLLIHGKNNREIADMLFIAPHTVKNHIYAMYQKLGVKNRIELVNFFLEHTKK